MNSKTAKIISHTHWDREWYLNSKYTNEWLVPFFDQLFKMFEKEENYQFVLDGQMAMIDDYYEELKKQGKDIHPYREKIRKYNKENRLFLGPYYLQPDWQLLSEEALVRNMLIGNKKAAEYGNVMRVGWLLDNFGQISQASQIHKECNMRGLYVWRGVEMNPKDVQSEFIWESPDGTTLPSVYLLNSYRNVMRLAEYSEIMQKRIFDEVEKLTPFATTSNILMMNGYDQEMVPDDIQPYIKNNGLDTDKIKVVQSNPEDYLDSVLKENPKLNTLKGALYSGRFIAVFPGVMSARMYLKLQNDKDEKYIEKLAEPLSALSWLHGDSYDSGLLEQAWELVLKNHPHDSICGVSIDDVHIDMEERSKTFHFLVDSQIRRKLQHLARAIDTSKQIGESKFVYNPSLYKRSEVIEINAVPYYIDNIPAMGYTLVKKNDVKGEILNCERFEHKIDIENNKIKVSIKDDGSFDIFHKDTNKSYTSLGVIEDTGDAGDEYNYSYPNEDKIFSTKNKKAYISIIMNTPERVVVEVRHDLEVPEGITDDRKKRSEFLRKMPIVTYITVDANSDVVKCKTEIKNTVRDHIVRVLFPTNIETDCAFAGSPFDVVQRPISIDEYDESMIPEHVRKVIIGAREAKPNTIFLGRELVDLSDGKTGVAVLSKGLPEYTVRKEENTVALTLFRGIGWIAKEINTRIGDAGPEIFTPEAQCLRQMKFEYAVFPHKGNYEDGNVLQESDKFNSELVKFVTEQHTGELPLEKSFFSLDGDVSKVKVTGIKCSENKKGLIIRLYNGTTSNANITLNSTFNINKALRVNVLEEEKEQLQFNKKSVALNVGAKKIETIFLDLDKNIINFVDSSYAEWIQEEGIYDFSEYESVELVKKEEIQKEIARAEKLKCGLNDPMLRRTALEAQLSAILTQNRADEVEIKKLGYQLNEARVERRVHDYIAGILKK